MRRIAISALLALALASTPRAATVPAGFQETVVFSGLNQPTAVRFARDGRIFVAEKRGVIKVFDGLSDQTADTFIDLRTKVYNYWDRGLLGLALHPNFPTTPYVYVLYTLDALIGGTPPRWGTAGADSDGCPDPPGGTGSGCAVAGRLSRLEAAGGGNVSTGVETVLLEDFCQQFPSHSIGTLAFGGDGMLYVTAGDGASFNTTDYGQLGGTGGVPRNLCGDPPVAVGATPTAPTAEGGALRSQDLRTLTDRAQYDGAVLRLDPITGVAAPGNPLAGSTTPGADRIVAYGLRNPFRMTVKPGTNEVWIGDVGWSTWEEINRIANPTGGVLNFGWPCYEGNGRQSGYDGLNLNVCETLYQQPSAHTPPVYTYNHASKVVAGESCGTGSSSISGLAFHPGGQWPPEYEGALFFADYSRKCIWAMPAGHGLDPDPAGRFTFAAGLTGGAVHLEVGPDQQLYFCDLAGGQVRRIAYVPANRAPTAVIAADVTSGPAPLTVRFDGSGSSDPDPGDTLSYAWDLDGDGAFDDSTAVRPVFTYGALDTYAVGLRVTDPRGGWATDYLQVTAGNTAPTITLLRPTPNDTWRVGDPIPFAAVATDPQEGALGPAAFTWTLIMDHCPSDCHQHFVQDIVGVDAGEIVAPDHEYPSAIQLRVTVTDAGGLSDSDSVQIFPEIVTLSFNTVPQGMMVSVGPTTAAAPLTRTVIVGSVTSVGAPSPQTAGGTSYGFVSWSDGGAQAHQIVAPAAPASYTATFHTCGNGTVDPGEQCDGGGCCTASCTLRAAGTTCRAAAGSCDVAEACTGTSAACPANALVAAGTVCRPATGSCDVADACTGASAGCPADAKRANGTSCSDGNACNGAETCQSGACAAGTALTCNDGNPCTDDRCDTASGCVSVPRTGSCNDGNACTTGDACAAGTCAGTPITCPSGQTCSQQTGTCSGLAAPWATQDVGTVGVAGRASANAGTFTLAGSGTDIWDTADGFRFVHQPLSGDGEIVARVTGVTNTNAWAKAGVMIRESLAAGARHAMMVLTPGNGAAFQRRTATNGASTHTAGGAASAPLWVRLVRSGQQLQGYRSGDGVTWTLVGTQTLSMGTAVYAGLVVTSHANSALCTATFDGVQLRTGSLGQLPSPWVDRDIGTVGAAGGATFAAGQFSVRGAGADIWNAADGFHFVHQPLRGDGTIVARVVGVGNTNTWAKAGVMIRETLASDAKHAMMVLTPGNGAAFQRRLATGAASVHTAAGAVTAPRWVRLERQGSTFRASLSSDGVTWTLAASDTVSMATDVYVGLAVTSHSAGVLTTATFDGVSLR